MKILLLDIETAPNRAYVWGIYNQNVAIDQIEEPGYTICWSAKWYGQKGTFFSSIYQDTPEEMIRGIHELLNQADVVVHYNGNKFDIPVLNKEFITYGLGPTSPVLNVDLLNTVRKRFRFSSNKLDFVANYLGLGNKTKHKGMALWKECMEGDKEAWKIMEAYNKQDINLLEKLYERLLPWISPHPNYALFTDEVEMVCPNCGSKHVNKRGVAYTKTMTYQRYCCSDCGTWSRARKANLSKEKKSIVLVGV